MVSRKGIALTAAIIGGFVAASFLIYLIPQSPQSSMITVADAREHLQSVLDRTQAIVDGFQVTFRTWENGEIDKNTLDTGADVALEQLNVLILELRGKQIPSEWNQSYFTFIQALESYRDSIEKSKDYVGYRATGAGPDEQRIYLDAIEESLDRAERLKKESIDAMP